MSTAIALRNRLERVAEGYASDPEYTAGLARKLAGMNLAEYMWDCPEALKSVLDGLSDFGVSSQSTLAEASGAVKELERARGSDESMAVAFALFKPLANGAGKSCDNKVRSGGEPLEEGASLEARLGRARRAGNDLLESLLSLKSPGYLEGFEIASGGVKLSGGMAETLGGQRVRSMRAIAKVIFIKDGNPEFRRIVDQFLIEPLAAMRDVQNEIG